jgi:hypothetical protein
VGQELFDPQRALFITSPVDGRRVFPNQTSGINPDHLAHFRFCGQIIVLALAHKVPLGVTFCSALLDALSDSDAGVTMRYATVKEIDPELYASCEKILDMEAKEVHSGNPSSCYCF